MTLTCSFTSPEPLDKPNYAERRPNCHHELAVIAVVVPTKAAHIPTPEVITTHTT